MKKINKKKKIKVLLLENIHTSTKKFFQDNGYEVKTFDKALGEEELIREIEDVSILGIRSKTKITKKVLDNAPELLVVGAFCIGTDQIDMNACNKNGVAVFNAPYSSTRSVVELTLGEMIMLLRRVFDKSVNLHKGIWDKGASGSFEMRGKTLGIIGYGNIGSQLSFIAESLGMKVCFFDLAEKSAIGNAEKCKTMEELLKKSDIVTIHIDARPANKNLMDKKQFALMKKGSYFLNLSRGNVVNLDALADSLKSGYLKGAGIDVFPEEPKNNNEKLFSALQNLPNVILTPHVGGSTEEAQRNISNYVSAKLFDFIATGNTNMSNNLPNVNVPLLRKVHRIIHIHENIPGILAKINDVFADYKINISGQHLATNQTLGYVLTDIDSPCKLEIINKLKLIPSTIKVIMLS